MVAFAADYAPTTEAPDAENRARGIFLAVEVRAGENGARSRHPRREKVALSYETASGPTNFLNRDPIGELGGLNLYAFVGNDPVNFSDAFGLQRQPPRDRRYGPGIPTVPGRRDPPPMQPPSPTGYGKVLGDLAKLLGRSSDSIQGWIDYHQETGRVGASQVMARIEEAASEICEEDYRNHPSPAPKGCGCCVIIVNITRQNPPTERTWLMPAQPASGPIVQVHAFMHSYVPRKCDDTQRGEMPGQLLHADQDEYVIKTSK